jgi:AraC-like DNA-binding protein
MMPTLWLSRFVEAVRVVDLDGPTPVTRLPDGRTSLVLRVAEGGRTGDLSVLGPRTRALFKTSTGISRTISIDVKPGWSTQLLGVTANLLTDRIIKLDAMWGNSGAELCERLLATRDVEQVLDMISHALAKRAEQIVEPAAARLARRAVRLLETEDVRIAGVATRLGVSARHLRRAFVENVGVGPKEFARALRLNRAVRAAGSADWGRVAANTGYYDQAHLIGEFRELVGLTPNEFARRARLRSDR